MDVRCFTKNAILTALALFAGAASASTATAGEPRVAVSPLVAYTSFPSEFGFTPAFGFGASLSVRLADGLNLLVSGSVTSTTRPYDAVGGTRSLPVQATEGSLLAEVRVAEIAGFARLSALGGVGLLHVASEDQRIGLGALGETVLPGSSDTYATGVLGAAVTGAVLPGLALRLEPRLNAVQLDGALRTSMSINAGVSLGLF
jgi:hypothetical protein